MDPVEELVALEAIKKVKHQYAHNLDGKQLDELVALFTEDAVCEFGQTYGQWTGHDEIRAGYQVELDKVDGIDYPFMHAIVTPVIDLLDETTARGKWFLVEMGTDSSAIPNALRLTGVYTDDYRKVDGRWLIARTHLDFTWPMRDISPAGAS
jgi:ketosteroid isomerase-like protein